MKHLAILGSTGSIGCNTLEVIRHNANYYAVTALVAGKNVRRMVEQCLEFSPQYVVMDDEESARQVKSLLLEQNIDMEVLSGQRAACEVVALNDVEQVMAAIAGVDGLLPTLAAIHAGKTILLANKESLVTCGRVFMEEAKQHGARILPVDSEHNAIFQSLPRYFQENLGYTNLEQSGVSSILLTGSGGPFQGMSLSAMSTMTPEQACRHPNWSMGRKISVDSATMMNKGLEYIEARWLFNASAEQIEILIHPQSIIHSMVRYIDGSVIAQLGRSDMRISIAYSMAWPQRITSGVKPIDFSKLSLMTFHAPDYERHPCLRLAIEAFDMGQAAITALNAANEVAVAAFLNKQISFTEIAVLNQSVLEKIELADPRSIDEILAIDIKARETAQNQLKHLENK